jgi:hypothetical protein
MTISTAFLLEEIVYRGKMEDVVQIELIETSGAGGIHSPCLR